MDKIRFKKYNKTRGKSDIYPYLKARNVGLFLP